MKAQDLEKIGFTQGEGKVYLALLQIGQSTTGRIIKETGVSNSRVYEILQRLSNKGLVSSISINNVKHFEAKEPSRIQEFLDLRQGELNEQKKSAVSMIAELESLSNTQTESNNAEILQGTKGIKTFLEILLNKLNAGDTNYILGASQESIALMGAYFSDWHVRRIKKGIVCKILYNPDAKSRAHVRKKDSLTTVRLLPTHMRTPAFVDIGKDYVATLIFGRAPFCVVIKNTSVAQSYVEFFEMLWKQAEKID